jgi:hypothetical protein
LTNNHNRTKLDCLPQVRLEMARLYRKMKTGKIDSMEGTRLIYALKEIRCCLESEMLTELEARMANIQQRNQGHIPQLSGNGTSMVTVPTRPN